MSELTMMCGCVLFVPPPSHNKTEKLYVSLPDHCQNTLALLHLCARGQLLGQPMKELVGHCPGGHLYQTLADPGELAGDGGVARPVQNGFRCVVARARGEGDGGRAADHALLAFPTDIELVCGARLNVSHANHAGVASADRPNAYFGGGTPGVALA